jgi:hypothetical protein
MTTILISALVGLAVTPGAASADVSPNIFESGAPTIAGSQLDRFVFDKLHALGMHPLLCSDAVFVRRAYLDVIGTLPTADEAREFIQDTDTKNKRGALIDRLLKRNEFADYWAMKWGDVLRIKAEFPINLWPNAAQAYHRWVRASIAENKPYDKFVREMLTASGSNFRVGPVNFYRAVQSRKPEGIAAAVALTFMGSRVDSWKKGALADMAVFFAQIGYKPTHEWKEEYVFWDPYHISPPIVGSESTPAAATIPSPAFKVPAIAPQTAVLPDGTTVQLAPDRDPREVFADWLIRAENPWFARHIVNRIWYWLLGRGIVHEPDDIRPDNPARNPDLVNYLGQELLASHYDLRHIYRLILNSKTYQLSSMPRFSGSEAEVNFAVYPLRRLDAEVLIDAVNKITGASDLYTSAIPEPFTFIPRDKPAIALPDGSITSSFLALFGRSARATGMENERNNKLVPAQWLYMMNSSEIQGKLEQSTRLQKLFASGKPAKEIVTELFLTVLSRFPTAEELHDAIEYAKTSAASSASQYSQSAANNGAPYARSGAPAGKYAPRPVNSSAAKAGNGPARWKYNAFPGRYGMSRHDEWIDVTWALLNSSEFVYRH